MRAILSAPGSRGDVNPMIAIGKALRAAGHDVVISLAEPYAPLAEQAGLTVEPVIDRAAFEEAVGTPTVWKPIRGPIAIFRLIIGRFLELHRDVIERHHRPGETVLVAHPLDLASRIYRDANPATPLATVLPQPVTLRTYESLPRLSPYWFECKRPEWLLRTAYWTVDRMVLDRLISGPVNQIRKDYGLRPISRFMDTWWLSPDRVLAMFPDWFAPATQEFLPQLVHCGFPLDDVSDESFELPDDQPIVFTSGTAHQHCRDFFRAAAATCQQIHRPGLLLSTHDENFPVTLPDQVRTASYLPLAKLLPACRAIVHHGGIGTTSQAFAAAVPQLIRPLAFDQFDNATRVEMLGCGKWLRRPAEMGSLLKELLQQDRSPIDAVAQRCQGMHGGQAAATILAGLLPKV